MRLDERGGRDSRVVGRHQRHREAIGHDVESSMQIRYVFRDNSDLEKGLFKHLSSLFLGGEKGQISDEELVLRGVHLVAPTKGMIVALKTLCKNENIPIKSFGIGRITKQDIIKTRDQYNSKDKLEQIYDKNTN